MYGGIENTKKGGKIQPNGDLFSMRCTTSDCNWSQCDQSGDEIPAARAQHVAVYAPKTNKMFVFGGHHTPQQRLNDTWFLNTQGSNFEWTRAKGDSNVGSN